MEHSSKSRSAKRASRVFSVVTDGGRRAAAPRTSARDASSSQSFSWRHLTLRVKHTPNYINAGWSHLELTVVAPKGAPCPITATGYLSHFLDADDLARAGGAVAFFAVWLDRKAATKLWAKTEAKWRQLDLFR